MSRDHEPEAAPAPPQRLPISEQQLLAARRRRGLTPGTGDGPACGAPAHVRVVDGDGACFACDFTATPALDAGGTSAVEAELAERRLPLPHCSGCAMWAAHDLFQYAPPLRDYAPNAYAEAQALVLRLPDAATSVPALLTAAGAPLPSAVAVEVTGTSFDALEALLAALTAADPRPGIELRLDGAAASRDGIAALLDGYEVGSFELTLDRADDDAIATIARVAEHHGAPLRVRFELTPARWFDFEPTARSCAEHGVPIDWRTLRRGGQVPLAALSPRALQFVADVIASAWRRFDGEQRPASVSEHALEVVRQELDAVLLERVHPTTPALTPTIDGAAPLGLPGPGHLWNGDQLGPWWWEMLFGRVHQRRVRDAASAIVLANTDAFEEHAWLRALAMKIAAEHRTPELLQLLHDTYISQDVRHALQPTDDAFAQLLDAERFGGPWATKLGVGARSERAQPFEIGTASPHPDTDELPEVTVLIPSYRHEHFIEQTIRSVLAQRNVHFQVLVVDDLSPDDTVARARAVDDPRVTVRKNQRNLGLGNSVLAALESITTPYVALLNSDDLFHPDRLQRCLEVLHAQDQTQLVTTGLHLVDGDGGELLPENASLVLDGQKVFDWVGWYREVTPTAELTGEALFAQLLEHNFLATSSNLVARREWLLRQADSLRSLKYCLDWQLFLEAALEGALHHIPEPLAAYRLHATNTVWFREGRRWAYYLEVNRVAAESLHRFVSQGKLTTGDRIRHALESVAEHLADNSEIDGLALFLNSLLDRIELDDTVAADAQAQELVEQLNRRAQLSRLAADAALPDEGAEIDEVTAARLYGQRLRELRSENHELLGTLAENDLRLFEAIENQERLETEKRELYDDQRRRIADAERAEAEKQELYADQRQRIERAKELEHENQELWADQKQRIARAKELEHEKVQLWEDQQRRIERIRELEAEKKALYDDQKRRIERARELEADKKALYEDQAQRIARAQQLEQDKADLHARARGLEDDLGRVRDDLGKATSELDTQHERIETLEAGIAAETAQVRSLTDAKNSLEARRDALLRRKVELEADIARLLAAREYRTGNFIWNKTPLGYMSRRAKKWYHKLLDAKDRTAMWFRKDKRAEGTAIVAACWQWPIYSHTFVYQEMVSLTHMGLDVQLFHWDLGDTDQLHAAFQYLYEHRTHLKSVWENHKKDKEHFEKTRPGRLRALLERISPLCGKSVEELEKAPIVMQACTFARMAELANARYIHSYFFYDQTFMAMVAAWLLDLPRGVSCYADHMMDDYEFKLVALNVELCDVIVATSARIKQELSQLSGGSFDDKIIVKPNGVDGDRFPARTRPARTEGDPFEVISVSRIEPKKGLTYLVEAIAMLNERGHKVIAHVIGSKDPHSAGSVEYSDEFEACIKRHGLEDQVILHGMMKQEQMPPIIEKSRAFVAPYIETDSGDKDGIPTAMLEALASSLPVITTDSGSITEVIDDGVEGLIVPQRDSKAYADALEKVITDQELEQRLAKAARARFDRDFDTKVTERRLHERVRGFLAEKARAKANA